MYHTGFSKAAALAHLSALTHRFALATARGMAVLLLALSIGLLPAQRQAMAQSGGLLRDTETEQLLDDMARPVFLAAGISPTAVRITIINDASLNAFVSQGLNMFIHSGLLLAAESPDEVIGVMAHETGHIAGGHLIRLRDAARGASRQAILATIVGLAAAIGGGNSSVGTAIIAGGQQIAGRSLLSFTRTQEASADAAAMTYLDQSGEGAEGFLRFMERLGEQDLLPLNRQVAYARTHPLTRDRIDAIRHHVAQDETEGVKPKPLDPALVERFHRMQAKLLGYLSPRQAFVKYPSSDHSIAAEYAHAIALWRTGDIKGALGKMDWLLAQEPDNPYFHEQKAQILFEAGRIEDAAAQYAIASDKLPDAPLTQIAYAQALLETHDQDKIALAGEKLRQALNREPDNPFTHHLLGLAYGEQDEEGLARLELAEEALLRRELPLARGHLERAKQLIPATDTRNRARLAQLEQSIDDIEQKMKDQ